LYFLSKNCYVFCGVLLLCMFFVWLIFSISNFRGRFSYFLRCRFWNQPLNMSICQRTGLLSITSVPES
jgi:hypothetical protein